MTDHNNADNTTTGPPLLRVAGLKTSQLPPPSATAAELRPFIAALLREGVPFIDTVAPKENSAAAAAEGPGALWKPKGRKTLPESDAKVDVTERVVTVRGGNGEGEERDTWVCRRSVHADSCPPAGRSACWAEFVDCIRDRHAETEELFTPGVLGRRVAVTWAEGGAAVAGSPGGRLDPVEVGGVEWGRFGLSLVEMKHRIPPPLRPRVFPVVQLIASAVGGGGAAGASADDVDEFVVVSVTVDDFAEGGMRELAGLSAEKGVVVGAYASVERVRRLPPPGGSGSSGSGDGQIEWIMATASDARGVLPMWLQTRAVPGQIAKDVGMFLGWIAGERAKGRGKGKVGGGGGDASSSSAPA